MPTKYNRQLKCNRGQWTEDQLKAAGNALSNNEMGVNEAARHFGIPQPTLRRRIRRGDFNKHGLGPSCLLGNPHFKGGTRVFNLDETAALTVQNKQGKVVALKGLSQVSKVTNAERGTLVTTCCIISAAVTWLPPAMIFPRVHFKPHMLHGAPPGMLGLASKSGWMNNELFVDVLKHFIKHSNSSKENPSMLLYDNHESHIYLVAEHRERKWYNSDHIPPKLNPQTPASGCWGF
ncbi:uncharacterized protein isoform X2 [Leptinotarsa decemlineata]|uniref:uncharacterized protein isoform X2 n=1 Tax=Leptinotarsa decemlineata TaxID=7539 RepID=UPI003D30A529